jgi:hypothetical protein
MILPHQWMPHQTLYAKSTLKMSLFRVKQRTFVSNRPDASFLHYNPKGVRTVPWCEIRCSVSSVPAHVMGQADSSSRPCKTAVNGPPEETHMSIRHSHRIGGIMKKFLVGLMLFVGLLQITSRATAQVGFSPGSGTTWGPDVQFSFLTSAALPVRTPQFFIDGSTVAHPLSYTGTSNGNNTYGSILFSFGQQFGAHTVKWTFNNVTYGPYPFYVVYPVPAISALSPRSAAPGSATINVTVTGSGFTPQSQVRWNTWILPVRYVSATTLTATVDSSLLASTTTANVTVTNPVPLDPDGTAQAASFTVGQPVPTLAGLNPSSATAGSADIKLTASGSNFNTQSVLLWNGSPLATSYLSPIQVTATVPAAKLATVGTATVTVSNSASGGATTVGRTFSINNPVPTLSSISPTSATHGSAAVMLTVTGTNFNAKSTILWKGTALTTTYVSATQLTASVPAANLTTVGTAAVTVFNPTPGGGTSTAVTFTIN